MSKTSCDLSASWDGLLKAILVSNYIKCSPGLLPVLRLVLRWGYHTGLTGHGEHTGGLNSNFLVFLMLMFCVSKEYIPDFDAEFLWSRCHGIAAGQISDDVLCNQWMDAMREPETLLGNALPGEAMLTFFQTYNETVEKDIPQTFASLLGVRRLAELLDADHLRLLKEHMQRAFHLLALYGDVKVLVSLSASEVHRVVFLSASLSIIMAGSERHNARELSRKSGARVTIRPKLPGSGFGLVLDAIGTDSAVAAVERALDAMATQAVKNKMRIISILFVNEASQMVLECCHSDDDYVSLVPYYGEHHQWHDSLALYVPLLSNPAPTRTRTGVAFTRHDFFAFQEKFLTQAQVIDNDFVKAIHGEMEFLVHFGRIYVFNVPRVFTEDTEPVCVSAFQSSLRKGDAPRTALSLPAKTRRTKFPFKGRKYRPATSNEEKKKRKEKPSRSSFFTTVSSGEKAESFLRERCFREVESSEHYMVDFHDDHEFCMRFDRDLKFFEFKFPKLRWCVTDVKRTWQERPETSDVTELDGIETDVRFLLQSRRALAPADIRGTGYEKYRDALKPAPRARSADCPFVVKEEVWKDVALIRHKKSRIYRLDPDLPSSSTSEFRRSLTVYFSDVTEYSRPVRNVSEFNKVHTRCEVSVQAALPSSWGNSDEMKRFLRDIWAFAFAFSSHVSN